ncbi:hypothetical protein DSCO28_33330 [Desulfosarcina ovata subsp. sediminis]|uniref:F5/8 type C domain-containing protein n=1 Tax=Desulfosarcina ovata subsp. sediminis TaxID=885957 RepID=A0A5K7ZPT9_9BACT|nr:hypothetical protein DSCO28_33330 [Desulfosarcina ovata subsp. sediminis]
MILLFGLLFQWFLFDGYFTIEALAYDSVEIPWNIGLPGCEADSSVFGYRCSEAIDDNPSTIWHTQWGDAAPSHPHYLQIGLEEPVNICGFRYLPRQDMENGRIDEFRFYTSMDGITWEEQAQGHFINSAEEQERTFSPVTAQYAKLEALSEVNGWGFTSVAELVVLGSSGPLPLEISPESGQVGSAETITFAASGGTPPYTFDLYQDESGATLIDNGDGTADYAAGSVAGIDIVRVTDDTGVAINATVSVNVLSTAAPLQPTALSPSGGVGDLTPEFEWTPFESGGDGDTQAGYQIRVAFCVDINNCDLEEDDDTFHWVTYDTGFVADPTGSGHVYTPGAYAGVDSVTGVTRKSEPLSYLHPDDSEDIWGYRWSVRYRDSGGNWSEWCGSKKFWVRWSEASLTPSTSNVSLGSNVHFKITDRYDNLLPYHFYLFQNESGATLIDNGDGTAIYTAGTSPGTDKVHVNDYCDTTFEYKATVVVTDGSSNDPLEILWNIGMPGCKTDSAVFGYRCTEAIDGDPSTIWHTQWGDGAPSHPHYLQIGLEEPVNICGFRYLPRQDMENGRIDEFRFYTSMDGITWEEQAQGHFINSAEEQEHTFSPVTAQYAKLEALSEVNGWGFTSVAELVVLGSTAPPLSISPESEQVSPEEAIIFTASGGTPPYTLSLNQNESGATLIDNGDGTATYTAGSVAGTDIVRVTDATGTAVDAIVAVNGVCAPLKPTALYPTGRETINTLTPEFEWTPFEGCGNGDTQAGYQIRVENFYILADCDNPIGIVYDTGFIADSSGNSHVYTAGAYSGVDPVTGDTRISRPLNYASPNDPDYGLGGYRWYVRYCDTGGNWSEWSDDSCGNSSFFPEPSPISITPSSPSVSLGGSIDFNIAGGRPDYYYYYYLVQNESGATLIDNGDGTAIYTAGTIPGTDIVRVTDYYTYDSATVTITDQPIACDPIEILLNIGMPGCEADSSVFGYRCSEAIDGDPNTIWHTTWGADQTSHPHWIILGLSEEATICGFRYLPRQDMENGRIDEYRFYTSLDGVVWEEQSQGNFTNTADEQERLFTPVSANFIKLEALSEVNGEAFTSVAELVILGSSQEPLAISPLAPQIIAGAEVIFNGSGGTPPYAFNLIQNESGAALIDNEDGTANYTAGSIPGTDIVLLTDEYTSDQASVTVTDNPTACEPIEIPWNIGMPGCEVDSSVFGYRCSEAIDDDPSTIWHTTWGTDETTHPHWIILGLSEQTAVCGFRYLPRQDMENGRIDHYRFYTSLDGVVWEEQSQGYFTNTTDEQERLFSPVSANYIKLEALSEVNGEAFTSVAELVILGNP